MLHDGVDCRPSRFERQCLRQGWVLVVVAVRNIGDGGEGCPAVAIDKATFASGAKLRSDLVPEVSFGEGRIAYDAG